MFTGAPTARGIRTWLAGGLAMVLLGTAMVASGAGTTPARAMEGASLLIDKTVDGSEAKRDLRPGDSVTYRVEFRVNDEDADAPARVHDVLSAEFSGWKISGLTAVVGGRAAGVTLDLPGIAAGPSSGAPLSGTLGSSMAERTISVGIELPVQSGTGNTSGLGMSTRDTGVLEYTITVPEDLSPEDPILRKDLVNTATFTARSGLAELTASDSATIAVDNPVTVDVTPTKTWDPAAQSFQPGATSTLTIGARQTANVNATSLTLQDPADPALAAEGAATLAADNPFNYVDFDGFVSPVDPTTNLPQGADAATVEVYRFAAGAWNWVEWDATIPNDQIAGIRTTYTGSIPPGTDVTQGFRVAQRSTHRGTGESIAAGYALTNEVRATVQVPGQEPVSKRAEATLRVRPEQISVSAQKRFARLPSGTETENLTGITAGDSVAVVLRARNDPAPQSTTLDRLVITEPAEGSHAEFFGENLSFGGFDASATAASWPEGATRAELTWEHPGGPTTVNVAAGDPLPAAPAGVTGFEIAFVGAIAPGASSEIRYELASNSATAFVAAGATAGPFRNTIDVVGSRAGLDDDEASANASVSYVAPRIDVTIDKRVGPGAVLPGDEVVVQLDTKAATSGGRTRPVSIQVEDVFDGPGTFWDGFDATQILPPISRPTKDGVQADLSILYRAADHATWIVLATNPDENTAIPVPGGATGIRFVYSKASGLSETTYVKPNISFTARAFTRSTLAPTASEFDAPTQYTNTATAVATGKLDDRDVVGSDEDAVEVGISGTSGGTAPGPGGLWADKEWAHDNLTSQSGATSWTTQSWASTRSGFSEVRLQDPATTSSAGQGTVFEAFDLTQIRPIRFVGPAGNGTVDPLLRWDRVTAVQLLNAGTGDWETLTPPAGGWMNASGFVGHSLSSAQQASTIGVRLVVEENSTSRAAAAAAGDLTAPEVGTGVTASAEIREFRLDWQLRERARTADGSVKWVKAGDTTFNCAGGAEGCIDNTFGVTGVPTSGSPSTYTGSDTIQLFDGVTNVDLSKQVRPLPIDASTPSSDRIRLVAPNPGELAQSNYPTARYTLTASNSSTTPAGSRGAMRLGKIRVTDTSTFLNAHQADIDVDPFTNRNFANEVASVDGNHFDRFTLMAVSFGSLPGYIDTDESTVRLWLYDGTPTGSTQLFSLKDAMNGSASFLAALKDVIGIAVTYSGTDPATNGNRILTGDQLVMHLDVQLRATERLSGDQVRGGTAGSAVTVPNVAIARGSDPIVHPTAQPTDAADAAIELTEAQVFVDLAKTMSVDHGGRSDATILETDPRAPVRVLLTAGDAGTTAPLDDLSIEDTTASFWDRFELVSFGTPQLPNDADRSTLQVRVNGTWVDRDDFAGDLGEARGVRVVFDRADDQRFPLASTSWGASWGTGTLPFTVRLRSDAVVDWRADTQTNIATVLARNVEFGSATERADAGIDFSPGRHAVSVAKRAPNDTSTHQVDPLVALPWKLIVTNTGTSYLPITKVSDAMPATLSWDGEAPQVTVLAPAGGTAGLTEDPEVRLSSDGRSLDLLWPAGSRMAPGESVEIELGMILQPLATGARATNEVVVETGVALDLCTQPSDFGQKPVVPGEPNLCSNNNFVQPRVGTVIGARKTVSGETSDTLGENLVTGALDTRTGEECDASNYLPVGAEYTRNPCAAYTAVGATDTWKLEHLNSGTNPLSRMTIVDMLPSIGDKMLAGGAARNSTFRPVLVDPNQIRVSGLPSGGTYAIDVTTDPVACVGPASGSSLWVADPECTDATRNAANVWTPLAAYTGAVEDIAGIRVRVDMTAQPLAPAGNVIVEFETVNRVVDTQAEGLRSSLDQFADRQFAWNQNGVTAWDVSGNRVNLPAAPQRAGVTVKTGSLVVSKQILGAGADHAPAAFPVALSCTVPSGVASPSRVALDLGEHATVSVPANGSVTIDGIPIGADCVAAESGAVGAHGEVGRSIAVTPGVTPATDGRSAEVRIREQPGGDVTELQFANTYALGELVVEKTALSSNGHEIDAEQLAQQFAFELVCTAPATGAVETRSFRLKAGEQHAETGLPVGAECVLTETRAGGAITTTMTVGGDETDGASRAGIIVAEGGVHVLVSNVFVGALPGESGGDDGGPAAGPGGGGLETTGGIAPAGAIAIVALLLLVAGVVAVRFGRTRAQRAEGGSGSD